MILRAHAHAMHQRLILLGERKNSEEPSVSFRRFNPEAMFDQLVTTGTWDIVTNSPG